MTPRKLPLRVQAKLSSMCRLGGHWRCRGRRRSYVKGMQPCVCTCHAAK